MALLRAKAAIGKLTDGNEDVQSGINIVLRALESPIRQIAENAGVEGSIVVGKVLENKSQTFGFDAQTEQYVDMLNAGIVDPAKVVRVALQDAASIAGLMITTEAMVAETPKKSPAPAMPGGGWAEWTTSRSLRRFGQGTGRRRSHERGRRSDRAVACRETPIRAAAGLSGFAQQREVGSIGKAEHMDRRLTRRSRGSSPSRDAGDQC